MRTAAHFQVEVPGAELLALASFVPACHSPQNACVTPDFLVLSTPARALKTRGYGNPKATTGWIFVVRTTVQNGDSARRDGRADLRNDSPAGPDDLIPPGFLVLSMLVVCGGRHLP